MVNEDTRGQNLDEEARQRALIYAASTMHFVRHETVYWSHTDFTESWIQQQAVTYHSHAGKHPIVIDRLAQRHFETVVAQQPPSPLLGEIIVLGEEASLSDWDPDRTGRVTIIRCDPVDGTSALAHFGEGFASVVTIESRRDSGQPWKHFGGAIVRSDGRTVSWSRRSVFQHHVVLDIRSRLLPTERPPILDLDTLPQLASRDIDEVHRKNLAMSGAAVAAQSSTRRQLLLARYGKLIVAADYFDLRAGSPSAWPLCTGLLGWTIEVNRTTIHDSIHLYPFTALGGRVVDHEYRQLNVLRIIEENAGPEALEKIFPPYIAYSDDDSLELIRSSMADQPPAL
jgi:hypothetical protein